MYAAVLETFGPGGRKNAAVRNRITASDAAGNPEGRDRTAVFLVTPGSTSATSSSGHASCAPSDSARSLAP